MRDELIPDTASSTLPSRMHAVVLVSTLHKRLKGRLLFLPGVMVTSVLWQLHSSESRALHRVEHSPGEVRRGIGTDAE